MKCKMTYWDWAGKLNAVKVNFNYNERVKLHSPNYLYIYIYIFSLVFIKIIHMCYSIMHLLLF